MFAQKDLAKLQVLDLAVECLAQMLPDDSRKRFADDLRAKVQARLDEIEQEVADEESARRAGFQTMIARDLRPTPRSPTEIETERSGLKEQLVSVLNRCGY